jgi:hypothetical protein
MLFHMNPESQIEPVVTVLAVPHPPEGPWFMPEWLWSMPGGGGSLAAALIALVGVLVTLIVRHYQQQRARAWERRVAATAILGELRVIEDAAKRSVALSEDDEDAITAINLCDVGTGEWHLRNLVFEFELPIIDARVEDYGLLSIDAVASLAVLSTLARQSRAHGSGSAPKEKVLAELKTSQERTREALVCIARVKQELMPLAAEHARWWSIRKGSER